MKDSSVNKINEDLEFSNWIRSFYNAKAKDISDKGYEYARWFSTKEKRRQYKFTTISLLHHFKDIDFKNCLEIGCGPGTWTKLLIKKYPNSRFTCLDISKEMIKQFKRNVKSKKVKIIVNNFLDHDFKNKKYDLIFCSRAIEYIPDKRKIISKFYRLMNENGKGIIVTSPPHPIILNIKKAFGKKIDREHTQRISVKRLNELLEKAGFINIKFYPILFIDLLFVPTTFLFKKLYKKRLGLFSRIFSTSYIVKFERSKNEKL